MHPMIETLRKCKKAEEKSFLLYYAKTHYQLLIPNPERKGHFTENTGQVPILLYFGKELSGLYPPYPVEIELLLNPGETYLGKSSEIIPLAAQREQKINKSDIGEVTVIEFF